MKTKNKFATLCMIMLIMFSSISYAIQIAPDKTEYNINSPIVEKQILPDLKLPETVISIVTSEEPIIEIEEITETETSTNDKIPRLTSKVGTSFDLSSDDTEQESLMIDNSKPSVIGEEKITAQAMKMKASGATPSVQTISSDKEFSGKILNKYEQTGTYTTDLFTGSASYNYPIEVIPGTNGLEPAVSLSYNSHQTALKGVLGSAWSLNQNYIYRDTNGTLSNVTNDNLFLHFNGVNAKIIYSSSDGFYHTEVESYFKIDKKTGAGNSKGEYWTLKTNDGTEYRFGYNIDSEFVSSIENFVSMWNLDLITDTYGNKIIYSYNEAFGSDSYPYLTQISYNNGNNLIKFNYNASIFNGFNGYSYGTQIRQNALLNNIETRNNGNLVKRYKLEYQDIDYKKFLSKIKLFGSDDISQLPATEFGYNSLTKGWSQNSNYNLPISLGDNQDSGTRLFDLNGDSFDDIASMYNSNNMDYWINSKNGWTGKQTYSTSLTGGFLTSNGEDLGVRLFDINGDGRTDVIKSLDNNGVYVKKVLINTGTDWQESTISLPDGGEFIKKVGTDETCNPIGCSSGYNDKGVTCIGGICYRTCEILTCSISGNVVFDDYSNYEPDWRDDSYDKWDNGQGFTPQDNKCYSFEFTGSQETDRNDDSECYDLYTDMDAEDTYHHDCDGEDIDAYAGIGFIGSRDSSTWLKTIPAWNSFGYVGRVDNSYWAYRYFSNIENDLTPDESGDNAGDWDGFNRIICDEAGTYSIECAPTREICDSWSNRCGYDCSGEMTSPFVVMGLYNDYEYNNIYDAFGDYGICSDMTDDNDYFAENNHYKVTEYPLISYYDYPSCNFNLPNYIDNGVRIADVNGDGKADLIKSTSSEKKIWLGNNNGFILNSEWQIPEGAEFVNLTNKDNGVRIADVNGDGLSDLVFGKDNLRTTWINNGKGWIVNTKYVIPSEAVFISSGKDKGVAFVDLNGDGLIDILRADDSVKKAWINTGNGWTEDSGWSVPSSTDFSSVSSSVVDLNGDGLPDLIKANTSSNEFWQDNAGKSYLLNKVKNTYGGTISILYTKMADSNTLPFSGWVASSITSDNGLTANNQITSTTTYSYSKGLYDPIDKEFRGFNIAEEKLPDGTSIKHWFNQDKARKGLEYTSEIRDKTGNLYSGKNNNWVSELKNGYYIVKLASTEKKDYDGTSVSPKSIIMTYTYDNYGNIVKMSYSGDVSLIGDERSSYSEYAYDRNKWIISNPIHVYLTDNNGQKVRESWSNYNLQGDLIKSEINNLGGNSTVYYSYDSYGNLISEKDANGHITQYNYDSTNTFPVKVTNAKNHIINYAYDLGTGNLLSEKDANSYVILYKYDTFGRIVKEIFPYDSETYPTKQADYTIDGISPEKIKVSQREVSGTANTYDNYFYYDGFGNLIQEKSESEGTSFITKNIYYNEKGLVKEQTIPYYSQSFNFSSGYGSSIKYSYDVLDRILKVVNPDNTERKISYNHWLVSSYDENNVRKDYLQDAYGSIIQVKEYTSDGIYITNYKYDASNNLIEIKDNQNNLIKYSYDSLGRKIKLEDSDLGTWRYSYDKIGNIISQVDNKGNVITMSYDVLDRILSKSVAGKTTNYTYDSVIGTLQSVFSSLITINYNYDNRYRKISEDKVIGGKRFITTYTYDSLDRITSLKLPNNDVINYVYNNQNTLESTNGISNFDYNALGQLTSRTYNNKLKTYLTYNSSTLRLSAITTGNKQDLAYSYDKVGNVVKIKDVISNTQTSFAYDKLDRLIKAEKNGTFNNSYNFAYKYDSIGNILNISGDTNTSFIYSGMPVHAPSKVILKDRCDKNLDCNDLNIWTEDICINPGQTNSLCKYNTIKCLNNSNCGTDGYVGGNFCTGNNITKNYITFTCNNPGKANSSCSNITLAKLNSTCQYGCNNSKCNPAPKCFVNADCGTDGWIGSQNCSNNDVIQSWRAYSCLNPGTLQASCINSTVNKIKQDCFGTCSDGKCNNIITINGPKASSLFGSTSVLIDVSVFGKVKSLHYKKNDGSYSSLCTNCAGYIGKKSFSEGITNLTIRAQKSDLSYEYKSVIFNVDNTEPKVISVTPKSGTIVPANTILSVRYTENNLKKVSLKYGLKLEKSVDLNCSSGDTKDCSVSVNLSLYNGKTIYYQFSLSDPFKTTLSAKTEIKVDSLPPVISKVSPIGIIKNGTFTVSYTELNLKSVYLYYGPNLENQKLLSCNSGTNKICTTSVSLVPYNNNNIIYKFRVDDNNYNTYSNVTKVFVSLK